MTVITENVLAPALEAIDPPSDQWPEAAIKTIQGPMRVHTFVSPDCSFRKMDELLGRASKSILIYIYNVSSRDMLGLVQRALDGGIDVRVMYDRTDTRQDEVEKLESLGVTLRVAPSKAPRRAFTVCHQKYVVVDGDIVILGSANWATTSIPNPGTGAWKKGNREWLVALEHGGAAKMFSDLFELDWSWEPPAEELAEPSVAAIPVEVIAGIPEERPPADRILPAGVFDLDSSASVEPLISPQNYFDAVGALIDGARESIWIEQQYIKAPDGSPYVAELLGLLEKKKNLDIRIISSSIYPSGWEATRESLAAFGLEHTLRALNPKHFTHCHNKGIIVDGESVVVSSTNWSDNSIGAAREAGVLLSDGNIAKYYGRAFDFDWITAMEPDEVEAFLESVPTVEVPRNEVVHPADLA